MIARDEDEPCPACGGNGTIEVDVFDPARGGHVSVEEPCWECRGRGDDDYYDEIDVDMSPLERGAPFRE